MPEADPERSCQWSGEIIIDDIDIRKFIDEICKIMVYLGQALWLASSILCNIVSYKMLVRKTESSKY